MIFETAYIKTIVIILLKLFCQVDLKGGKKIQNKKKFALKSAVNCVMSYMYGHYSTVSTLLCTTFVRQQTNFACQCQFDWMPDLNCPPNSVSTFQICPFTCCLFHRGFHRRKLFATDLH